MVLFVCLNFKNVFVFGFRNFFYTFFRLQMVLTIFSKLLHLYAGKLFQPVCFVSWPGAKRQRRAAAEQLEPEPGGVRGVAGAARQPARRLLPASGGGGGRGGGRRRQAPGGHRS